MEGRIQIRKTLRSSNLNTLSEVVQVTSGFAYGAVGCGQLWTTFSASFV